MFAVFCCARLACRLRSGSIPVARTSPLFPPVGFPAACPRPLRSGASGSWLRLDRPARGVASGTLRGVTPSRFCSSAYWCAGVFADPSARHLRFRGPAVSSWNRCDSSGNSRDSSSIPRIAAASDVPAVTPGLVRAAGPCWGRRFGRRSSVGCRGGCRAFLTLAGLRRPARRFGTTWSPRFGPGGCPRARRPWYTSRPGAGHARRRRPARRCPPDAAAAGPRGARLPGRGGQRGAGPGREGARPAVADIRAARLRPGRT